MVTKSKTIETKKQDRFMVDPRNIEVEEGFNVREDYGDLKALAASIRERGVKSPLRCRRKVDKNGKPIEDKFIVTDGHRRLAASMMLRNEGVELAIPLILEDRYYSLEERLLDMWTCNDGEPLKPMEKANLVQKLIQHGWEEKDIAAKLGISKTYVINLERLAMAPAKIKKLVNENTVSSTYALQVLRTTKDPEEAIEKLEKEIASGTFSGAAGSAKRVTAAASRKKEGKVNSVSEMRKFFKKTEQRDFKIKPAMQETYTLLQQILRGEIAQERFFDLFLDEQTSDHEEEEEQ